MHHVSYFTNKVRKNSQHFVGVFNKTIIIIPPLCTGYEMVANEVRSAKLAIIILYPTLNIQKNIQ